jgi:hypothetical protein
MRVWAAPTPAPTDTIWIGTTTGTGTKRRRPRCLSRRRPDGAFGDPTGPGYSPPTPQYGRGHLLRKRLS